MRIAYAYEGQPSWRFRDREREVLPAAHRANSGHVLCALAREGLGIARATPARLTRRRALAVDPPATPAAAPSVPDRSIQDSLGVLASRFHRSRNQRA